jgi:Rap1a immunity proteins
MSGSPLTGSAPVRIHLMVIAAALVLSTDGAVTEGSARELTVKELLDACTENPHWFCIGYIRGAIEMRDNLSGVLPSSGACTPDKTDFSVFRAVFMAWAAEHHYNWSWDAPYGIWEAIAETWPCK